jgi:hypothetical protein
MRHQMRCAKIKYMRTRVQSEYIKQTRLMAMYTGGNKKNSCRSKKEKEREKDTCNGSVRGWIPHLKLCQMKDM